MKLSNQIGPMVLMGLATLKLVVDAMVFSGDQFVIRAMVAWIIYLCCIVWSQTATMINILEQIRDQRKPKVDDEKEIEID